MKKWEVSLEREQGVSLERSCGVCFGGISNTLMIILKLNLTLCLIIIIPSIINCQNGTLKKDSTSLNLAEQKSQLAAQTRKTGEYVEAVNYSLKAIQIYDSLGIKEKSLKQQITLSSIYKEMGGEKGTVSYLNIGLSIAKNVEIEARKEKYFDIEANSLSNQGIILRDLSTITKNDALMDSAFMKYTAAIKLLLASEDKSKLLAKLYNNISQVYIERQHNYPKALEVLEKAIDLNSKNKDLNGLTFNYANMANLYLSKGDIPMSTIYATQMLNLSKELKMPHRILNSYGHFIEIYKKNEDYKLALQYTDLYNSLADSLTNLSKTEQISLLQTKYESAKKEAQIKSLSAEKQIAKKEETLREKQRNWALFSTFLLGIMVYLFYVRYRMKKRTSDELTKKNYEIEVQKEIIQVSLTEKETLLREIHHRVKNNLQIISSLLNIQSAHISDENVLASIHEGQSRVQAMSLIHQNLYQSDHLSNVDIASYLQQLVDYLNEMFAHPEKKIMINVDASNISFDIDTAIPLGLIVNELVSNAFKYAFHHKKSGTIQVSITPKSDMDYELKIADDGMGLPENFTTENSSSLGLKLVKILSRQLRGNFSFHNDRGSVFIVNFKDLRAYNLAQ